MRTLRSFGFAVLAFSLLAGVTVGLPPVPVSAVEYPVDSSVPVSPAVATPSPLPVSNNYVPSPVVWPSAGVAVVDVKPSPPAVRVGGLPVTVSGATPSRVRLEVLERSLVPAGAVGLRIARADGGSGPSKVNLRLDYSAFRDAFGGGWAARLGLRLMPECGLSRVPGVAAARGECVGVRLPARNDLRTGVLSAEVDLALPLRTLSAGSLSPRERALYGMEDPAEPSTTAGDGAVVVIEAGPDTNGAGNFTKTSLKESATWSAGGSSGDFTFDYPMGVPPVPGGLSPTVGLDYSSARVDGQTSSENTQAGLVGEGWALSGGGFIESTFRQCKQDRDRGPYYSNETDTCWRYENFQLSWGPHSGELVPTTTPGVWKTADDDGAKVEYLTMGGSGPHWRVTTPDGTQWFFGRQRLPGWAPGARETGSVLGMQVWANHDDEPCFSYSGFAASHCWRPYRWMLDYAVDVHGNSMSYWYDRFTNLHGTAGSGWNELTYDRDAVLRRIEYGTRAGNETNVTSPPAKVEFTNVDRCWSACWNGGSPNTANWRETPWDLACGAAPCSASTPTFWSHLRLDKVATYVSTGSGYTKVDEWQLMPTFVDPLPSTTDVRILRLDTITRAGLPPVSLVYQQDRNRADFDPNAGLVDPQRLRLDYVVTESGGKIDVTYRPRDEFLCTWAAGKTQWPDPDQNSSRCYPQWLDNPDDESLSGFTWWHRFVVDSVTKTDEVGGGPPVTTSYGYSTAGSSSPVLWGYVNGSSKWGTVRHTHTSWKGYSTVETLTGPAGAGQLKTKRLFLRGLDRDKTDAGEFARTSTITDSKGGVVVDHKALAGKLREEIVYNGTAEVSKTIHGYAPGPWQTAGGSLPSWITQSERRAFLVRETLATTDTAVAGGPARVTETASTYNTTFGTVDQVHDRGEVGLSTDDTCTTYAYARNTQNLMLRAGTGSGALAAAESTVAIDWSIYDLVVSPGDFNSDGKPDVLARNRLNSHLYLFKGNGSGGFVAETPPALAGTGWHDADQLFSPGDWSGDGKPDVLLRRASDHHLYLARGNGAGGFSGVDATPFGTGWNDPPILSPGDISGDGKPDVLYRESATGNLKYVKGNGLGGWILPAESLVADAGNWNDRDLIFGRGDATGDGKTDLYARVAATGALKLYPGNGIGGFGAPIDVGSGWNVYDKLLTAGDLNGDGKLDVLAGYGGAQILGAVKQAKTDGVACGQSPVYPADFISDVRTSYDNRDYGAPPARALATRTEIVKSLAGQNPSGFVVTTAAYDQWGRMTSAKDPLNRQTTTTYTHNTAGLLTSMKITNPALHDTVTVIDPTRGQPTTVTDPNGKVTTGSYDALGRLAKVWQPGHPTTGTPDVEYIYSVSKTAASHVATKALGPNGNQITSYEILDGFLRPRQTQSVTEDGKRHIADTKYDARGLAVKTFELYNGDGAPGSTLFNFDETVVDVQVRAEYDGAGRQTKDQLWSDNLLKWQAETVYGGDRIGVIPPAGGTATQDLFDARGRLVEKRQFSGAPFTGAHLKTLYGYDDADRLTSVKDPAGNTWIYQYDLLGRKTLTVDPDAGTSTSAYDDAGQTISTNDARGQALFFEYDSLGRKTRERDSNATGPVLAEWTYDTTYKGQLASTVRYAGGDVYTTRITSRDNGYRPLHTELVVPNATLNGSLAGTYAWDNTYKPNGAPATTTLPGVGGLPAETLTYTYDTNGYSQTLAGAQTYIANTDYTFDGLVSQRLLGVAGKQVKQSSQYTPDARRLANLKIETETATPGTFAEKFLTDYTYDNAGNLTTIGGFTNGSRDNVECFRYDYLRRLTEAWTQPAFGTGCTPQRTGADPYWRQWTFDTIGNRRTQTDKDPAVGDTTWTYTVGAKPHQLASVTATGPKTDAASRTFGYDQAGNTTTAVTTTGAAQTLTWDKEGRLATVVQGGGTSSHLYDADGNRLIVRTPDRTTLYLPDGSELEQLASGGAALGTRYYADLAVRTAAGLRWTCGNHQGTGTVQIDSLTLATNRRRFLPYGEDRTATPAGWVGTKGYVGGTRDTTTYTHLGARDYDPTLGRFLSVDPVMDLTDPTQWNAYTYSNNNPTTFSDSSGLTPECGNNPGECSSAPSDTPPDNNEQGTGAGTPAGGGGVLPIDGTVVFSYELDTDGYGYDVFVADDGRVFVNEFEVPQVEGGPSVEELIQALMRYCTASAAACYQMLANGAYDLVYAATQDYFSNAYSDALNGSFGFWSVLAEGMQQWGFTTAAGIGGRLMVKSTGSGRVFRPWSCHNSFDPHTPVLMADGTTKEIRDVQVGDMVLATDPETGLTGPHEVIALIVGEGNKQFADISIKTADGEKAILATANHPFWVEEAQMWMEAEDLEPGMHLHTADGTVATVDTVRKYRVDAKVNNLTIAEIHTYYVLAGNKPVLVHNSGGCPHLNMDGVPEDLRPYIENVVRQMDIDGTLPPGVQQGGGRTGSGIYSGGGLPPASARYYVETDIIPTPPGGTRPSSGRLIFGGRGEVWYTSHYDDGFTQIRGPNCGC